MNIVDDLTARLTAMTEELRIERDAVTVQARFIVAMTCQAESQQQEIARLTVIAERTEKAEQDISRLLDERERPCKGCGL